jgi:hypothetical protein
MTYITVMISLIASCLVLALLLRGIDIDRQYRKRNHGNGSYTK